MPPQDPRDVGMTSHSSAASDTSWARVLFDKRRQPADTEGEHGKASPPAGAAAAASAAPAAPAAKSGFVGAFRGSTSVGKEQHPGGTGAMFGFGPGAGSAGSNTASNSSISSNNSNNVGPASAGDAAAATAAPSTAAEQDGNSSLDKQDQQAGYTVAPLPLLPLVPSAQTSNTAPGPAEVIGNANGRGEGLELLRASELEGAEAAADGCGRRALGGGRFGRVWAGQ